MYLKEKDSPKSPHPWTPLSLLAYPDQESFPLHYLEVPVEK
jgi:hypothetical protein